MKLHAIFNKIRISSRKTKVFVSLLLATAVVSGGVAFAGWSPERTVFDWNNPAHRGGSLNGPVFNSFINTPYYGDERAFFDSRRTDQQGDFKDILGNVDEGSREVILRTYVHNNANQETNSTVGTAHNAKVRIDLPTGMAKAIRARSYISASNAAPGYPTEVTDTTELTANQPFSVQYIPDSAVIYNAAHQGGVKLSDSIVTTGAPIGYSEMNGEFPGCFEFQALIEIRVKIVTPKVEITKQVRKAGEATYGELASVKPGEKVQWMIGFLNQSAMDATDVAISDQLPPHLQVVPNSVRWIYTGTDGSNQDVVQSNTALFAGAYNFGTWKQNGGFYIRFDTTAKDDFQGCEVTLRNIAHLKTKEVPQEMSDHADVKITKENCVPPTTPPTTPPVTQIPVTGAGDVIGIFVATSFGAALWHRLFWVRRFNRS